MTVINRSSGSETFYTELAYCAEIIRRVTEEI